MRILLVDDEPALRAVIRRILLRRLDVNIVECDNGLEALERLAEDRYAFVMLDLMMPVMDGLEVLQVLRQSPTLATLPVIMMTGANDAAVVRRIVEFGVSDYVVKPLRPAQLVERVSRVMMNLRETDPPKGSARPTFAPLELDFPMRVLIADGSDEFRQMFVRHVGTMCAVMEASSGIEAIRLCMSEHPYAAFIGIELGVFTSELLAQKLRRESRLDSIRAIGVLPGHLLRQFRDDPAFEALILRTFVPEMFLEGIASLQRKPGRLANLLAHVPDLKLLGMAAVEETVGLVLRREVVQRPLNLPAGKLATVATLLHIGPEAVPLSVHLSTARRTLPKLASKLRDQGIELPEGPPTAPLMHLLIGIAANVMRDLAARTIEVDAEPVVGVELPLPDRPDAPDAVTVQMDVTGLGVSLRLDFTAPPAAQAEAARRASGHWPGKALRATA